MKLTIVCKTHCPESCEDYYGIIEVEDADIKHLDGHFKTAKKIKKDLADGYSEVKKAVEKAK